MVKRRVSGFYVWIKNICSIFIKNIFIIIFKSIFFILSEEFVINQDYFLQSFNQSNFTFLLIFCAIIIFIRN